MNSFAQQAQTALVIHLCFLGSPLFVIFSPSGTAALHFSDLI